MYHIGQIFSTQEKLQLPNQLKPVKGIFGHSCQLIIQQQTWAQEHPMLRTCRFKGTANPSSSDARNPWWDLPPTSSTAIL